MSNLASKNSPLVPRKSSGIATKTSPHYPPKSSDTRQPDVFGECAENINSAARTIDLQSAGDKSKPLPPKKPLPSLPKGMLLPGQKPSSSEVPSSKPPLPQKPPPDLSSSSKTDCSQSSVAALAQKLSTIPVFPFRDNNSGKVGPSPGTSPRPSPHSSPRPSPRHLPTSFLPDKSDSKAVSGLAKSNDAAKPKLLPRPGAAPQKSPSTCSQPTSPRGQETQKHPPRRPSPPSADAVARARSRSSTVESLEDRESNPADDTPEEIDGLVRKSSLPERRKKSKSVSDGDIHRVASAEDQSEYAYAYEHTHLGETPPKRSLSARNPPTAAVNESDAAYVAPDESVVNEFMEDIHGKSTSISYEVADEQSVAGFIDSLKNKQTLNGMPVGELSYM
ncbi:hypothetical protein OS493_014117 [Desmophyllum pertusum]|uniref:Uncharacterized protein n=1 Tax=Desmophyllum pertusum TaxID=174260 RepID=A0A9W9ZDL0_9CNID|nr:hypothetical protein OS493_014117 [Desmophyllum pertusum]